MGMQLVPTNNLSWHNCLSNSVSSGAISTTLTLLSNSKRANRHLFVWEVIWVSLLVSMRFTYGSSLSALRATRHAIHFCSTFCACMEQECTTTKANNMVLHMGKSQVCLFEKMGNASILGGARGSTRFWSAFLVCEWNENALWPRQTTQSSTFQQVFNIQAARHAGAWHSHSARCLRLSCSTILQI